MYPNIVTDVPETIADNQPYILIIWSCDYNVFKSELQLKASRSLNDWFCPVVWPFFQGGFLLLWVKKSQQKQSQVFKEREIFFLK